MLATYRPFTSDMWGDVTEREKYEDEKAAAAEAKAIKAYEDYLTMTGIDPTKEYNSGIKDRLARASNFIFNTDYDTVEDLRQKQRYAYQLAEKAGIDTTGMYNGTTQDTLAKEIINKKNEYLDAIENSNGYINQSYNTDMIPKINKNKANNNTIKNNNSFSIKDTLRKYQNSSASDSKNYGQARTGNGNFTANANTANIIPNTSYEIANQIVSPINTRLNQGQLNVNAINYLNRGR